MWILHESIFLNFTVLCSALKILVLFLGTVMRKIRRMLVREISSIIREKIAIEKIANYSFVRFEVNEVIGTSTLDNLPLQIKLCNQGS